MELPHGHHLAYCTNIHRGENWEQTFDSLQRYTLAVRDRAANGKRFAIGLRLSELAARELAERSTLETFRDWLDGNNTYIFTINGFPYGRFHGGRVKEQVYAPDWTSRERLEYTNLLFDLLVELVPAGIEGSVSTLPGSFKEFIRKESQRKRIRENLWRCVDHIAALREKSGKILHLGLEPEPLGLFETSRETVEFLEGMKAERPGHEAVLAECLGVNYDTCHLAVEYEEPKDAVARFRRHGIKISKIHISSALRVHADTQTREALRQFTEDTYLHQVVSRSAEGELRRWKDLDLALAKSPAEEEWRIHFHIPLHFVPTRLFQTTTDHIDGLFAELEADPSLCTHLEMETYTWEVLPPEMRSDDVVDQLVKEYAWCEDRLRRFHLSAS